MTRHGEAAAFVEERAAGHDNPQSCVLWPFKRESQGYGIIHTARPEHRARKAHQVVLELAGYPRPFSSAEVRHLCGNRACVNLDHLKWGTRSENQLDRYRAHGDNNRGSRNGRARLSEAAVRFIRESGEPTHLLASRFSVSYATVQGIRLRNTWQHLPGESRSPSGRRSPAPRTHCRVGHELTAENTVVLRNARMCRICKNANARRQYHARKASK